MSTHLRIRNWDKYQHYKDRNPPWVKLYRDLLDNQDIMRLPDASKWLAVGLLLVAARHDNKFPNDPRWVANVLHMEAPADLRSLLSAEFLETCDASTVQAVRKQSAGSIENREQRAEKKKTYGRNGVHDADPEGFAEAWAAYPQRPNNPRKAAASAYAARLRDGVTPAELLAGVHRYAAYIAAMGTEPQFVQQAATFFGPRKEGWRQAWEVEGGKLPPGWPTDAEMRALGLDPEHEAENDRWIEERKRAMGLVS